MLKPFSHFKEGAKWQMQFSQNVMKGCMKTWYAPIKCTNLCKKFTSADLLKASFACAATQIPNMLNELGYKTGVRVFTPNYRNSATSFEESIESRRDTAEG